MVRFSGASLHVELASEFALRDVVEIVVRAEGVGRVIVGAKLRGAVWLGVGVVLARHVVGYEVNEDFQVSTVSALHQVFEFLHTFRYVLGQIGVYVIIILDGVRRSGLALDDGGMVGADIVAAVVSLCGVLDDARVPDVGDAQSLNFG